MYFLSSKTGIARVLSPAVSWARLFFEIDQKRRYLNLVHNLKTASVDDLAWIEIMSFYMIRNLIVHNHNKFDEKRGKREAVEFLKTYDARMPKELTFDIRNGEFLKRFKKVTVQYASNLIGEILNSPSFIY